MIPGVVFHPRSEWQNDTQPVTGPTFPNPSAIRDCFMHYPGGGTPPGNDTETAAKLRAMQHDYTTRRGYSLGYNFAIPPHGGVWEIRGFDIRNAANKGGLEPGNSNHTSFSIQFMVSGNDPATDEQIRDARLVVAEARRRGMDARVRGHRDVASSGTPCPGDGIYAQVTAGVFEPQEDDEMTQEQLDVLVAAINGVRGDVQDVLARLDLPAVPRRFIAKNPNGPWILVDGPLCREVTSFDIDQGDVELGGPGSVPPGREVDDGSYQVFARAAGL